MSCFSLNRKLVLEERQNISDGAGGYDPAWAPLGSIWAHVKARTGRETVVGARDASLLRLRITVRGAPQGAPSRPRADQRFRDGARIYNILTVSEADDVGRFLMCDCAEAIAS